MAAMAADHCCFAPRAFRVHHRAAQRLGTSRPGLRRRAPPGARPPRAQPNGRPHGPRSPNSPGGQARKHPREEVL
eukprot:13940845-Alexandrium_andersonii.AAC.1